MVAASSLAAAILAVVFVWAAVAKLREPNRTATAFAELGLPRHQSLARFVPLAELSVAVLLILVPGLGGLGAFALLAVFTAVLAQVLRSGAVVHCNCFGASSDQPVNKRHLGRNGLMLVLAGLASTLPVCVGCYLWVL